MSLSDQIKGKTNEVKGAATDDKKTELKGKMQQALGNLKDKAHDVADDMKKKKD